MIIDSHSHWLPREIIENAHFFSSSWGDIESHVKMMDEAGIDKAVLSYPTSDAHLKLGSISQVAYLYNDNVAKIIKRFPDKFIGAAVLPVDNSVDMVAELKRTREELGFRALSLASSYNGKYLDDKIFAPLFKEVEQQRIPIFVHPQIVNPIGYERVQDPLLTPVIEYVFDTTVCIGKLLMSGVFHDHPALKFVFAYFGGVVCHIPNRFDATYAMLRGMNFVKDLQGNPTQYLKNIYVDSSGDMKKTNFLAALELLGSGHILWGSDWPAKKDIRGSIKVLEELELPQQDVQNMLGGNVESILA
jgi:predicted TIM-barrel fold metal-dependent hydrolase